MRYWLRATSNVVRQRRVIRTPSRPERLYSLFMGPYTFLKALIFLLFRRASASRYRSPLRIWSCFETSPWSCFVFFVAAALSRLIRVLWRRILLSYLLASCGYRNRSWRMRTSRSRSRWKLASLFL